MAARCRPGAALRHVLSANAQAPARQHRAMGRSTFAARYLFYNETGHCARENPKKCPHSGAICFLHGHNLMNALQIYARDAILRRL